MTFFGVWLVLFISLLSCVKLDQVKVVGHEPIHKKVGDDVILPCHLKPKLDVSKLTIEWRFQSLHSNGSDSSVIFLHRNRAKDDETSDPNFKARTSLFYDEIKNGNISLKLTNVTKKDGGNYICFVPKLESQVKKGKVTLKVDENGPKGNLFYFAGIPRVIGGVALITIIIIIYFFKRHCRGKGQRCMNANESNHPTMLTKITEVEEQEETNMMEFYKTQDKTNQTKVSELS